MAEKAKVFIAEDNQHFCELYKMVLGGEGYQVHFAHTGKEAVEKIPAVHPDLIILDVMMPEMDGYEVCRRLREQPEFAMTPIIMLTALSTDEDQVKGYDVGVDDYITKPFSLKVLKSRVRSILERAAERKLEEKSAPPPSQRAAQGGVKETPAVQTVEAAAPEEFLTGGPLETVCGGPVPTGSNILVVGALGGGKSLFTRQFLAEGLLKGQRGMFICLDDDPSGVRRDLGTRYGVNVAACESQSQLRFVDAYSWSGGRSSPNERFAISGTLELSDLSVLINEAGGELGQSERDKKGGRRVVDSLSSLFLNFELSYVQRFVAFLARSGHFAGVSTIFVVEQGACDEQALNNICYIMDGVLELKNEGRKFLGRTQTMKWATAKPDWIDITQG